MSDTITKPDHYHQGTVDALDAMAAIGIDCDFARGSAIKYLWRLGDKDEAAQDLYKALYYVGWLIGGRLVAEAVVIAARGGTK